MKKSHCWTAVNIADPPEPEEAIAGGPGVAAPNVDQMLEVGGPEVALDVQQLIGVVFVRTFGKG